MANCYPIVNGSSIGSSDELNQVVFIRVYSLIDSIPASLRLPLCFIPPNGADGDFNLYVFTNTIPALTALETLIALPRLVV